MNLVTTRLQRKFIALASTSLCTLSLCAFLSTSALAATKALTIPKTSVKKLNKNKPASKIEIITAVKKKYSGRILSVRKRYKAHGTDCHHVKIIDKKGELLLIHVACS
jgi:hypothetical protein